MTTTIIKTLRGHTVHIYFEPWINGYRSYSNTIGPEDSPYGDGKTVDEALTDLDWRIEDYEEKRKTKNETN